jgi:hyperosmotically inducible protein
MSVKMALAFQPGVKASDIDVDTDRGTVTLSGSVRTETERQLAEEVAVGVTGVELVVNEIHLKG